MLFRSPPFGMREFKRIYTGPQYARRLVETALAAGVEIQTLTTVVEAMPGAKLLVSSDQGISEMSARRIIYATGTRETPRSARLISGSRPLGVMNTGALQTMVYLKNRKPFERPVIVGTELGSFSAIATCRHMGIKPVAMLEENARITTRLPLGLTAPIMGVPLYKNTRLVAIQGGDRVSGVEVEYADGKRTIDCDGVVLTGKFIPEASLARCGHLKIDAATGALVTDESGHCSDSTYFAVGNVLKPLKTAGKSWHEGRKTGWLVAEGLAGER